MKRKSLYTVHALHYIILQLQRIHTGLKENMCETEVSEWEPWEEIKVCPTVKMWASGGRWMKPFQPRSEFGRDVFRPYDGSSNGPTDNSFKTQPQSCPSSFCSHSHALPQVSHREPEQDIAPDDHHSKERKLHKTNRHFLLFQFMGQLHTQLHQPNRGVTAWRWEWAKNHQIHVHYLHAKPDNYTARVEDFSKNSSPSMLFLEPICASHRWDAKHGRKLKSQMNQFILCTKGELMFQCKHVDGFIVFKSIKLTALPLCIRKVFIQ